VYRPYLFVVLAVWLTQPLLLTAQEEDVQVDKQIDKKADKKVSDPMRLPRVVLQKYGLTDNSYKPKVVVRQGNSTKTKTFELTSILYSATRKIAIIDDKMLSVGDKISGAKLVSVKKYSARLIRNGKTINLRISNGSKNIRKSVVSKTMDEKK
jgi:hypothetical protein